MALRLAVAADAPKVAAARNVWAALRPDIYGTANYTEEQALADITAGVQRLHLYETAAGKLRGFIITNECEWYDPDDQRQRPAIRIGDLCIDPAVSTATTIRTAMQALKDWAKAHRPLLRRLVGEIIQPSGAYDYFLAAGYRFIASQDNGDGTLTWNIDRQFDVGTG